MLCCEDKHINIDKLTLDLFIVYWQQSPPPTAAKLISGLGFDSKEQKRICSLPNQVTRELWYRTYCVVDSRVRFKQLINFYSVIKQPSIWPFVSTNQISHLVLSIKKKLLNVTKTMSRKCSSWKQAFRISSRSDTLMLLIITEECFVIILESSCSDYSVAFISLSFEVWRMRLFLSSKYLSCYHWLQKQDWNAAFPLFDIFRHSLKNYQERKTLY